MQLKLQLTDRTYVQLKLKLQAAKQALRSSLTTSQEHAVGKGPKHTAKHVEKHKGQPDKSQAPARDHRDALNDVRQVPSTSITNRVSPSRTADAPEGRALCSPSISCHDGASPTLHSKGNLMDPIRSQQGHTNDQVIPSKLKSKFPLAGGEVEDLCIICLDAPPQVVFHPCLHAVVCTTCAQRVQAATSECPLCRSKLHSAQALTG